MSVSKTKGEATRENVLESALRLFRKRGFEQTTMRDIARAADLSLGAAYHYFPSKEALVLAYYEWTQGEHERLVQEATAPDAELGTRIRTLLETKLGLLRRDRKLLAALFANLGDPSHPLSIFGKKTSAVRRRSLAQFVAVFDEEDIPPALRALLGYALWLAHLGVFVFLVHDGSADQVRTRKLTAALVELVAGGVPLLGHPLAAPVRRRLLELAADLELPNAAMS